MAKNDNTSAIVDGTLRILATGGALTAAVLLPGLAQVLEKPVLNYLNKLEGREREREFRRVLVYMKKKQLIDSERGYNQGILITPAGLKRLRESEWSKLQIKKPRKWDRKWRLVIYDIPEKHKKARQHLTRKLGQLGFIQLQRSAWVHPFPSREEIAMITHASDISRFVSYIEADHIDQGHLLVNKFKHILK